MRTAEKPFVERLVSEEIRRLVAEAIAARSMISVLDGVAKVRAVYSNCGLSKRLITDEIIRAAAAAGVGVAFGPTGSRQHQEKRAGPERAGD